MRSEKRILLAFLLNLGFSIFELIGGLFTGSVAIASDALHDMGDAVSIGISYFLEKKSKRQPDQTFTYGYLRYSVLGSLVTTGILIVGSVAVVTNSIFRIIHPTPIHYDGMILLGIVGVCVNLCAALVTREGDSLGQKAVNLHMLEDVLGWVAVLIGAIIMRFTDMAIIDPLLCICIGIFILVSALKTLKCSVDVFLERTPQDVNVTAVKEHLLHIDGITDVHHIHVWSLDGQNHCATMHVVTNEDTHKIKLAVREELAEHGICHVTVEIETPAEHCDDTHCQIRSKVQTCHHHHHH